VTNHEQSKSEAKGVPAEGKPDRVRLKVSKRLPFWRRNLVALSVISVLALVLGVVYLKKEALRWTIGLRTAERHMQSAQRALEEGDSKTARRLALAASGFLGPDIRLKRLLLKTLVAEGDPGVVVSAISLFNDDEASIEDKAYSLGIMNAAENRVFLTDFYKRLSEQEKEHPDIIYQFARFLLINQAYERAIALIDTPQLQQENRFQLQLAEVLAAAPEESRRQRSQQILVEVLTEGEPEVARSAYYVLGRVPPEGLIPESHLALRKWFEKHPPASAFDHLVSCSLDLFNGTPPPEEVFRRAVRTVEPLDKAQLCAWLLQRGRPDMVLATLNEDEVKVSGVLFSMRITALTKMDRYGEALAEMGAPHPEMDQLRFYMMRAVIAEKLNRQSLSSKSWDLALQEAAQVFDENRFLEIGRTAVSAGAKKVAAEALFRATLHRMSGTIPFRDLGWVMAQLASENRTEDLLQMTRRLLRVESDNVTLKNNLIYFVMLLEKGGGQLPVLIREQRAIVEKFPDDVDFRSTLALGQILVGDGQSALTTMSELKNWDWQAESGVNRAILAVSRAHAGDHAGAKQAFDGVDWQAVMELERNVFESQYRVALQK